MKTKTTKKVNADPMKAIRAALGEIGFHGAEGKSKTKTKRVYWFERRKPGEGKQKKDGGFYRQGSRIDLEISVEVLMNGSVSWKYDSVAYEKMSRAAAGGLHVKLVKIFGKDNG